MEHAFKLAQQLLGSNNPDQALSLLQSLPPNDIKSSWSFRLLFAATKFALEDSACFDEIAETQAMMLADSKEVDPSSAIVCAQILIAGHCEDLAATLLLSTAPHWDSSALSPESLKKILQLLRIAGPGTPALRVFEIASGKNRQLMTDVDTLNEIAEIYEDNQSFDLAIETLAICLRLNPNHVRTHTNLNRIYSVLDLPGDAERHRQFLQKFQNFDLVSNVALEFNSASKAGTLEAQEIARQRLLATFSKAAEKQENYAAFSFLLATDDALAIQKANEEFSRAALYGRKHIRSRLTLQQGKDRIRLIYISPDFRNHAVSYLIHDLIKLHDRMRFHVTGIGLTKPDLSYIGKSIHDNFDVFLDASELSTIQIAEFINQKRPNITIDLAGYTKGYRPGLMNRIKFGSIINFLGYPSTMGSEVYDYIIGDKIVTPEANDDYFCEKIIRLNRCYQPNSPSRKVVESSRRDNGLPSDAFIFASFNARQKINLDTVKVWREILHKCTDSVIWLYELGERTSSIIDALNISRNRVIVAGHSDNASHLGRIQNADVILDTFPYGAHTTASDSIYRGIPIISRSGESFQSRVCFSLMYHAGIHSLNSETWNEYLDKTEKFYLDFSLEKKAEFSKILRDYSKDSHPYNICAYLRDYETKLEMISSDKL